MNDIAQTSFDYEALDGAKRSFAQIKANSIKTRMRRAAKDIIAIGCDLIAVKEELGHGLFLQWIDAEFGMSDQSARNFIHVAEKFSEPDKFKTVLNLSPRILYELAAPSTPSAIIEGVESGEIPATLDAIKAAKEAQRQAEERARKIEEEARLALVLADDRVNEAQTQLRLFEEQDQSRRSEVTYLSMQIEALERQLAEQSTQIVEIEKPVVPKEITEQLEKLQSELKERTEQRDNLADLRERLSKALNEQRVIDKKLREQELYETRVKQGWQQVTDTFNRSVTTLLTQFPSIFDAQIFDNTDWTRLDHAIEVAQRFMAECEKLRTRPTSLIVEAS